MYFKATMETKIKLMTYLIGYGIGLGIPLVLSVSFFASGKLPLGLVPAGIVLLVFFITYLYRPLGYEVDGKGISVVRPIGKKFFPRVSIASVTGNTDILSLPSIGLWRSGGFYGIYGIFWTRKYGRFLMYVTNCKNIIEIALKDGLRVYLSPDAKQAFLDAATGAGKTLKENEIR